MNLLDFKGKSQTQNVNNCRTDHDGSIKAQEKEVNSK